MLLLVLHVVVALLGLELRCDLIRNISLPDAVFAERVTDFCCIPGLLLESKITVFSPVAPGAIAEYF